VERHLPEGSLEARADMEFLCKTHDPRKGDHLLRAALASAAGADGDSPAVRVWKSLSWYGLAGYAALHAACCPDAPVLGLPVPGRTARRWGRSSTSWTRCGGSGDVDYDGGSSWPSSAKSTRGAASFTGARIDPAARSPRCCAAS
jgi:hypothetical protein